MTKSPLVSALMFVAAMNLSPVVMAGAASAESFTSEQIAAKALKSYQDGAFEEAAVSWTDAARLYEQAGRRNEQSDVLLYLAQTYQALGRYTKAMQYLGSATALVEATGDRQKLARIKALAGNLYVASGQIDEGAKSLNDGLQLARELGNSRLAIAILNDKGSLLASQKKYSEALASYMESVSLAQATNNGTLAAQGLINAATVSLQNGQHKNVRNLLDQALQQVGAWENSYDKSGSLISIGRAYNSLRPYAPEISDALLLQALHSLNEAVKVSTAINNPRAESYAWGYLGSLYEKERRYAEALDLTRRAVTAAQQAVAPESLYRWYWQTGRLFKALEKRDDAIKAYRRAVPALQSIRPEMLASGAEPPYFRESVGPLFFELADLLLQQAASMEERERSEPYLREARDTIEQFKVAELRDYFRDECVDAARSRSKGIESVSKSAAVVYPIILPDRLELLVSLATGLQRVSVPVKADVLTKEIRAFRKKLEKRTTQEYLPYAQQLYGWLIRPIELVLASLPIDTLVFVPDGALLTIPMAALHDGKQFLISQYAVAVTPGLTLTDPRPLKRKAVKALAVGLTESVQNFPPLPNVAEELEAIQQLYPGTLLLNKDFLVPRVEKELKEGLFTIMHVASHGQFETDVRKTFLLTFDDKLTMEALSQYIGVLRFREEPLELLTLSACQTAAGDDRAALGLAGVGIKAGARSALATLWFINDQASSVLVSEFYRQLQDPAASKAVALQRAQLKMLDEPAFDHPAYWAPFLLLNNWL